MCTDSRTSPVSFFLLFWLIPGVVLFVTSLIEEYYREKTSLNYMLLQRDMGMNVNTKKKKQLQILDKSRRAIYKMFYQGSCVNLNPPTKGS